MMINFVMFNLDYADIDDEEDDYDIANPYTDNILQDPSSTTGNYGIPYNESSTNESTAIKTVQNPYYDDELDLNSRTLFTDAPSTGAQCTEKIVISQNPYYE